jgi:hypothetical protein
MTPPAPWRVAIVTRIPPVVLGYLAAVEEAGHEPVAVLSLPDRARQYGPMGGIDLDGEIVRVLASSLTEVADARRIECADGPLWLVMTEPYAD